MWSTPIDLYCERCDASFWAEPVNALSNVGFLIAAAAAWAIWRRRGRDDIAAALLIGVTVLVGLGSFAFHTLATRGAMLLDVVPIALFIHGYLYLALRRFIGLGMPAALGIVVGFFALTEALDATLPRGLLNGSIGYLPALGALLVIGALAQPAALRRSLLVAAGLFTVSLAFRTVDLAVCASLPLGTHAAWHLLNAVVLYRLLRTAIVARAAPIPA